MASDEQLIGFALQLLNPSEQQDVEQSLRTDPALAHRLTMFQQALFPFAALKEDEDPPAHLVSDTIARVARQVVESGWPEISVPTITVPATSTRSWLRDPHWPVESEATGGWRPTEILIAGSVALLAVALMGAGVQKLRHDRQVAACQNQMRQLHQALSSYSAVEDGRLPQVGTPAVPTAGTFAQELQRKGHLGSEQLSFCPESAPSLPFAYTLGYRTPRGTIRGLTNTAADWTPILADLPSSWLSQVAHSTGQNVLFLNGSVRFCTGPKIGLDGDDIYRNEADQPRAGLHPWDTSLGDPTAVP